MGRHENPPLDHEMVRFDRYLDDLVQVAGDALQPLSIAPDALTAFANRLHTAAAATPVPPDLAENLLQRLLAVQQGDSLMTSAATISLGPRLSYPPQPRRTALPGSRFQTLAAVLTLALVSAIVIGFIFNNRAPDEVPVFVAPTAIQTADGTPTTAEGTFDLIWQVSPKSTTTIAFPGVTIAPDGTIWVADAESNAFRIYSADGDLIETWGAANTGDAAFDFTRTTDAYSEDDTVAQIAFAPDGSFYVLDAGHQRVVQFAADRTFVRTIGERGGGPGQFLNPFSVAVDPGDSSVLVSDDLRNVIQRFDADGNFVEQVVRAGQNPGQISGIGRIDVDHDSNLWAADSGSSRIQKFSPSGDLLLGYGTYGNFDGNFARLVDVTTDGAGNSYTTDLPNKRVQIFDPVGQLLITISLPRNPSFQPSDIALAEDGSVYVASYNSADLYKFRITLPAASAASVVNPIGPDTAIPPSFTGQIGTTATFAWQTSTTASPLIQPGGVAIAPDGTIWIPDIATDVIQIFQADGTWLESFGSPGSGTGQFSFESLALTGNLPYNVSQVLFLADGRFVVSDPGNHRFQIFAADRTFVAQFGEAASITNLGPAFVLPDGSIGVFDPATVSTGTFDLVRFDADGQALGVQTFTGYAPIAFAADGTYWAVRSFASADTVPIRRYSETGEILASATIEHAFGQHKMLAIPIGTIDGDGRLWFTNNFLGVVIVLAPDGSELLRWNGSDSAAGMMTYPFGLALDGANQILVVDLVAYNVGAYTATLP